MSGYTVEYDDNAPDEYPWALLQHGVVIDRFGTESDAQKQADEYNEVEA